MKEVVPRLWDCSRRTRRPTVAAVQLTGNALTVEVLPARAGDCGRETAFWEAQREHVVRPRRQERYAAISVATDPSTGGSIRPERLNHTRLLLTQHHHRIHARGPTSWQNASRQADRRQGEDHCRHHYRVEWPHAIQMTRHHRAQRDRTCHTEYKAADIRRAGVAPALVNRWSDYTAGWIVPVADQFEEIDRPVNLWLSLRNPTQPKVSLIGQGGRLQRSPAWRRTWCRSPPSFPQQTAPRCTVLGRTRDYTERCSLARERRKHPRSALCC